MTELNLLRHTGIEVVGDVPWGTHFCQFYSDKQDLTDLLVPYFKAGLESNELCIWVASEPLSVEEAKAALAQGLGNLDSYLRSGQLEILEYQDWDAPSGALGADRLAQRWVEKLEAAGRHGFDGLRLNGNPPWLDKSGWQRLTEFEATVYGIIGRYPMLAICSYSLGSCGGVETIDTVRNHAFAVTRHAGEWVVLENLHRKRVADELPGENIRDIVLCLRRDDGRILEANAVAAKAYGYARKELLALSIRDLRAGGTQEVIAGQMAEAHAQTILFETVHRRKDGSTFPVEVSSQGTNVGGRPALISVIRDITGRKHVEEALRVSERRARVKLDNILSPQYDIGKLELGDVIDAQAIQSLMDDFYKLARIPMAMIDLKGKVLVGVGWQDVCTKFHRVHPKTCENCMESDTKLSGGIAADRYKVYKCKNNMWDVATPLVIGGQHVGNLFLGQFFFEDEPLDRELFRSQAARYGFKEEEYMSALEAVPRLSRDSLETGISFLMKLGHGFSQLSYSNLRLAHSLSERDGLMASLKESGERLSQDIAERKQVEEALRQEGEKLRHLNRALKAHSRSNQTLFHATDEAGYLQEVCRIIIEDCGHAMVWVGFAEDDPAKTVRPAACNGFEEGYLDGLNITWADTERGRGPTGTAIRTGRVCACRNILTDSQFLPWRKEAARRGYASSVVLPLMTGEKAFGALSIYSREPDGFSDDEVKLLAELASDFAYGINVLRLRAAHQRADQALRKSEELLRMAHDASSSGAWEWDLQTNENVWSEELWKVYGLEPHSCKPSYEAWRQAVHPNDRPAVERLMQEAARTGTGLDMEFRVCGPGIERWLMARGRPFHDANGQVTRFAGIVVDVTHRKRAEEALRQAYEQRRLTLDAAKLGSWEYRSDTGDMVWDERCRNLFGIPAGDQIDYHTALECIHAEDRAGVDEALKRAISGASGGAYYHEFRVVWRDGSVHWVASSGRAYIEGEGDNRRRVRLIGVNADITDRRRADASLRENEERLRLAHEAAGMTTWDWNIRTGELTSPHGRKIAIGNGSSCAASLAAYLVNAQSGDRSHVQRHIEAALARGEDLNVEFRAYDAAGTPCWRACHGRVLVGSQGAPVRMIGLTMDITHRKVAEEARQNETERERLKAILQSLTEGIIIADPEGNVLSMNPTALRLHELEPFDPAPAHFRELEALFELTDLDGHQLTDDSPMARLMRAETFAGCDVRVQRKGGRTRWVGSYGGAPVYDGTGNLMLAVLTVRDVTAERLAAEEVRRANTSLHQLTGQLLQLQDEERRHIARELHDGTVQVLTALSMNVLLIGQSAALANNPQAERLILESQALAKQASRELRTLSYLLYPPELEGLGLVSALRSWADGFSSRTGISLEIELDDPGRLDLETETALFRIVQESLANVQRHSGSSTAAVRLAATDLDIRLEVEDAGRGFPPGVLERDNVAPQRMGVGIMGMRERARRLSGSLQILCDGKGTMVRAVFPREVVR